MDLAVQILIGLALTLSGFYARGFLASPKEVNAEVNRRLHQRVDTVEKNIISLEKELANLRLHISDNYLSIPKLEVFISNKLALIDQKLAQIINDLDRATDLIDSMRTGAVAHNGHRAGSVT